MTIRRVRIDQRHGGNGLKRPPTDEPPAPSCDDTGGCDIGGVGGVPGNLGGADADTDAIDTDAIDTDSVDADAGTLTAPPAAQPRTFAEQRRRQVAPVQPSSSLSQNGATHDL
jgi:hypothetical protein